MRKVLYIFAQLDDQDIEWFATQGRVSTLSQGTVLIREGVACSFLYIVLDGRLRVSVEAVGEVARLGAGEIIGEMSFVEAALPSATVTAAEDSVVLALDRTVIDARLGADFGFAARFYKALAIFLAARLRTTTGRIGRTGTATGTAHGEAADSADSDRPDIELDPETLDGAAMAGARFKWMMRKLLSAPRV